MAVDAHLASEDTSHAGVLSRDISMEPLTIVQSGNGNTRTSQLIPRSVCSRG